MRIVTATELKENFVEYMELGQKEEIGVTHQGELIFFIVPRKEHLKIEFSKLFGSLPKEVYDDDDIDRE